MKGIRLLPKFASRLATLIRLVTLISLMVGVSGFTQFPTHAQAPKPAGAPVADTLSRPASGQGYVDFLYGPLNPGEPLLNGPSGEKPESKLWWNDGFWWGILYNHTDQALKIYRLNWGTQTWEDTGVVVDDRGDVRADALWDNNKLYVVSHVFTENSGGGADANAGQFRRYIYNAAIQEYTLDGSGFPKTVNSDKTETLVLAKEPGTNARLWVAYVSRPTSSLLDVDYQVYVNSATNDGNTWGTPVSLASLFEDAYVEKDDIASIVAFGNNIGVMWSQQVNLNYPTTDKRFRFAVHAKGTAADAWVIDDPATQYPAEFPATSDDHINLKVTPNGQVLAAVKTTNILTDEPLTVLLGRETDGNWVSRTYSLHQDFDTQPTLLVDQTTNLIYMFVSGDNGGSQICYKTLALKTDLSKLGDFTTDPRNCGTPFIEDATFNHFDKPTSTKGFVTSASGIVVLATDNYTPIIPDGADHQVYGHGVLGDPAPVITARTPYFNATGVSVVAPVVVTFSHDMNPDTLTAAFSLKEGANTVDVALTYDSETYTATFTPSQPLKANTTFTAAMTTDATDKAGHALYSQTANTWTFTTEAPTVQFSLPNYSELEGATAVITAMLNTPSSLSVDVNYATIAGGTAVEGVNYETTANKLTFTPGEVNKTFNVTLLHNPVAEGDKTVKLELSSPVGANLGEQAFAVLTILDVEQSSIKFVPASFNVDEGAGNAVITVQLSHPNASDVTFHVATSNGTGTTWATAGSDYVAVSRDLVIPAAETSLTFNVPILNDTLDEADETVTLTLSSPSGNAVLGDPGSVAVLTIKDDDPAVQSSYKIYIPMLVDGKQH